MYKYDFDTIIDRVNTDSFKWDGTEEYYNESDAIGMWCADMDFACPPPIVEALKKRVEHPIYGYTLRTERFKDACFNWLKKRHNCNIKKEWLAFAPPGVIYAIHVMLNIISKPGEGVMVHMPNYDPLFDLVVNGGRKLIRCPLYYDGNKFRIDFELMEKQLNEENPKALIMSSPHNPTGRVWEKEELEKISELCIKHNVYIFMDEIHADFVDKKKNHIAFSNLGEEAAKNAMICYSANKGFNLGGLQMSTLIIADEEKRNLFNNEMRIAQTRLDTTFGAVATEVAYTDHRCEEWLDEAIQYVEENKDFTEKFLKEKLPCIKMIRTEGTYLGWFDCHALNLKGKALEDFMVSKAKVAFCAGYEFGDEGEYYLRMTMAVPRKLLERALNQVKEAVDSVMLDMLI